MEDIWVRACELIAALMKRDGELTDVHEVCDLFAVAIEDVCGSGAEIEARLHEVHGISAGESRMLGRLYEAFDYGRVGDSQELEWARKAFREGLPGEPDRPN